MPTAKSRAWFFPTSPRSPYRLQEELRLLKNLEGRTWNLETQYRFAALLAEQRGHSVSLFRDPHLTARDRVTRAPRMLGLVHLPRRGLGGTLRFTTAGDQLIDLEDPTYLYQRQLAKVQFGSALHYSRGFEQMNIRPMLAMIAILNKTGSLSKEEIALFVTTTTDYAQIQLCVEKISLYRQQSCQFTPGHARRTFRLAARKERVTEVYREDITEGRIAIRERRGRDGLSTFIETKYRNLIDYADATIRYLQASRLFTISPLTQRFSISNAHEEDAQYLLDAFGLRPVDYTSMSYGEYVDGYLGNADTPTIRKDQDQFQAQDFERIVGTLTQKGLETGDVEEAFSSATSRNERHDALRRVKAMLAALNVRDESRRIASARTETLADIKQMYRAIAERSEIIDKPLMYEWNTWRAMVLVNDALDVRGHFKVDTDGNPLMLAPGKVADMIIEYQTFWLLIEVTLQRGYKQYESEGESIVRHVGLFQKEKAECGDERPIYALFVSERINDTVIAYLQTQARFAHTIYGGAVRIVPMDRETFERLVEIAVSTSNFTNKSLREYFDDVFSEHMLSQDSVAWFSSLTAGVSAELALRA